MEVVYEIRGVQQLQGFNYTEYYLQNFLQRGRLQQLQKTPSSPFSVSPSSQACASAQATRSFLTFCSTPHHMSRVDSSVAEVKVQ